MPLSKLDRLIAHLKGYDRSIIAYSGGVDSTFLIKAASMAGIDFMAVTSGSETMPGADLERSKSIAGSLGVSHLVTRTEEMSKENFTSNPPDRCYHCKDTLFSALRCIAEKEGYKYIMEGSNADDAYDHRPGLKAARDHGVLSPLKDCGLTKSEIRSFSRKLGLMTWDIPSSPCLSSRFPYGVKITARGLSMVSRAEDMIRSLGFRVVRVRTSGAEASIEVGKDEIDRMSDLTVQKKIESALRKIGYITVRFDPEGYVSGKLNRSLPN